MQNSGNLNVSILTGVSRYALQQWALEYFAKYPALKAPRMHSYPCYRISLKDYRICYIVEHQTVYIIGIFLKGDNKLYKPFVAATNSGALSIDINQFKKQK